MKFATTVCLLALVFSSCKAARSSGDSSEVKASQINNQPSTYLSEAGDRAKAFFYEQIDERNKVLKSQNSRFSFSVMDARDPKLYAPGRPPQPLTPADKVIVKIADNGNFLVTAYLLDGPGYLKVKDVPTGNFLMEFAYAVDKIEYRSRFDGLFASVTRNFRPEGFIFIYYVKGYGNNITPARFDEEVGAFLKKAAIIVTPF